jgi:glycosyltransferase involved in cell wall biosynthesis
VKIAVVVPGGVDRSGTHRVIPAVLWVAEALTREHAVHIFALRQEPMPGRWRLGDAHVTNVGRRPRLLRAVPAIVREHRRAPFDFLWALWAEAGVPAAVAGRILRRPVLLHLIGGDVVALPAVPYGLRLTRRGRALLRIATLATRMLAPSTPAVEAAARLGLRAQRVPLGVSLAAWPPRAPVRRDPAGPALLVHVASLNAVKDQHTLLVAVRALVDRGVALRLDIVGEDTLGGAVQREAAALGLSRHITFHGFLPQAELRPVVERSHVLLVSSRHETGPVAVLEAALAGVPTVGTSVGHVAEFAPDAALAVPVGDAAALAQAAHALLADEDRRLACAAAAQRRAIAEDAAHTARSLLEIHARTLAPPA